ncbi:MAG: DAK2 domain-containing protein [Pseudonocardiaceae bacterium]|nr:DAK2 domain-containing protein [Pseudonocardiaceae bacterium]
MRSLDAAAVGRWATACVDLLDKLHADIDEINVYPVPDSDTGSNLLQTMRSALDQLRGTRPAGVGEALSALAKGALSGARGNSGVILSQLLRGCAEELGDERHVTGPRWSAALDRAAELATGAVAEPAEGTILSVLHAAAGAARGVGELDAVAERAARSAGEALERTPEQLPVLAEAGVVDAGGRGLVAVFDAFDAVVSGRTDIGSDWLGPERRLRMPGVRPIEQPKPPESRSYEVMYLLEDVRDGELATLRTALTGIGDCVTVAGDGAGRHAIHVHCDDIGAAIEAGIDAGRPRQIAVTPLVELRPAARFGYDRAVLVVVRTEELAELVRAEGAAAFVAGGDEFDPAHAVQAIRDTSAAHVVVLAADEELSSVATGAAQRAEAGGQDVVIVPCASPVQGLAALAVHDLQRRANEDVVAMAEAAAATRYGELRIAESEALTWVGRCGPGDVLGLVDGEVMLVEGGPAGPESLATSACAVVERMLTADGELVTVLLGAESASTAELVEVLRDYLRDEHPEVDLVCYQGAGQEALVLLGVE